jgi:hypothetical protein
MAYSFQGFGTTFYGKRDFRPDGTYITTEWIIVFALPVIPLRSLRVQYRGPAERRFPIGFGSSDSYSMYAKTRPNIRQVVYTYAFIASLVAWAVCTVWLFGGSTTDVAIYSMLALATLPGIVPYLLRRSARRKVGIR